MNNNALICSKCCAEIRYSACEHCHYYKESQKFSIEKSINSSKTFTIRIDEEVDIEINRALELLDSGDIYSCEKTLKSLAIDNNDLFSLHFAMGVLHIKKEEYDDAIVSFEKSIAIHPYYIDSWYNKALAETKKLYIVQMVYSLKKVIEIGDENDEITLSARDNLNNLELLCEKESDISLDLYIESMTFFNSGFDFMKNQKWKKAILELEKSYSINPNSAPTIGNIAICYMKLNENEKAMESFNKSIAIDPYYEPAIINREILSDMIKSNISNASLVIDEVNYGRDYSIEDNKSLIDDYIINDKLKSYNVTNKKSLYSKLLNIFRRI